MLLFDHIATGLITSKSIWKNNSMISLAIVVIASVLPDLPVIIFGGPGTIGYLAHRRYTNSLILAPLYSLLPLILLLFIRNKGAYKERVVKFYFLSLFAYLLHIFFDYVTPFGTILFYPISKKIYSFDLLHSFDPIFLVISFSIMFYYIFIFVKKKPEIKNMSKYLILLYAIYMLIAYANKISAESEFKNYLNSKFNKTHLLATVPRTFWRWRGIAKSNNNYIVLLKENNKIKYKEYKISQPQNIITEDSYYQDFINYARFPLTISENNDISVTNLIYPLNSYKLIFTIDRDNSISSKEITGYDITDFDF